MIENMIPFPVGCETSRFFGAISSMHMAVLGETESLKHEFVFHVLYSVSGAGLFRLHQSDVPHMVKGYDANEMNGFVLDYIPYSINYLGYDFKKISAAETPKDIIWSSITSSIDKRIPVLFKVSGTVRWNVICGYGENMTLYGLDARDHYDKATYTPAVKPEGYIDNGYFYDSNWHDSLQYVLICTPANKTVTFKSALLRMSSFIENHLSSGLNANALLLKNSDKFFSDQSDEYLKSLYSYIDSILGYLMETSHHVSEAFGAVWKGFLENPVVNPQLQDLFSRLDGTITRTQGTVWEHWNYKPEGIEKYMLLKKQEYRDTLLDYLYSIAEDDKNALELIRQSIKLIGDDYIDESV